METLVFILSLACFFICLLYFGCTFYTFYTLPSVFLHLSILSPCVVLPDEPLPYLSSLSLYLSLYTYIRIDIGMYTDMYILIERDISYIILIEFNYGHFGVIISLSSCLYIHIGHMYIDM